MLRTLPAILSVLLLASAAMAQRGYRSPARFDPPAETFVAAAHLKALAEEIRQGALAEAARRLDGLLEQHGDEMMSHDAGGLISLATWVDAMPSEMREALGGEYARQFEPAAREALEAAKRGSAASLEDLYAVARRHGLCPSGQRAAVEAGDLALLGGDAPAALALYERARRMGWSPDAIRESAMAQCRLVVGKASGGAGGPAAGRGPLPYCGPLPLAAPWYGREEAVGEAKIVPFVWDDMLYIVAPRHVLAIRQRGQVAWTWAGPITWPKGFSFDQPRDRGRGAMWVPAALISGAGPQVLVVRQPHRGSRAGCLRALRASDGRLLWSTEKDRSIAEVNFTGNPLVVGRMVYAIASEMNGQVAASALLALDVTDGRVVWKTTLGTLLTGRGGEQRGWEDYLEQTEPAAAGDWLYAAPNVGVVFALDRFDGHIRWTRQYDPAPGDAAGVGRPVREGGEGDRRRGAPVPSDGVQLLRWNNTPRVAGDVVVVAPQDTPLRLGLDAHSGRLLWQSRDEAAHTLVGVAGGAAIFAGSEVQAVDPVTGKEKWRTAAAALTITGPSAVSGGVLYVPTSQKVVTISPETGRQIDPAVKVPDLRTILAVEPVRRALDEAGAAQRLGAVAPQPATRPAP